MEAKILIAGNGIHTYMNLEIKNPKKVDIDIVNKLINLRQEFNEKEVELA